MHPAVLDDGEVEYEIENTLAHSDTKTGSQVILCAVEGPASRGRKPPKCLEDAKHP